MQHVIRDAVARRWLEQSAHLRCDQPDATSKQCVAEPLDSIQFLILRARAKSPEKDSSFRTRVRTKQLPPRRALTFHGLLELVSRATRGSAVCATHKSKARMGKRCDTTVK